MKKVLSIFGTRPEAIKMAPVVHACQQSRHLKSVVCVTSQHREMQDEMLKIFNIQPDFDLNIMKPGQDLFYVTSEIITQLRTVLAKVKPDVVLVHGDTTTTLAGALAAFYDRIPIGHVEAGLRSYDLRSPFPEEANRQLIARFADYHFAPTLKAKNNLVREQINEEKIFITGNTVIDALFWIKSQVSLDKIANLLPHAAYAVCANNHPYVLVTAHRRENLDTGILEICEAIKTIAAMKSEWHFIFPVHLHPKVQKTVFETLSQIPNVHLINPAGYELFIYLMSTCRIILTDSGSIQEEAPSLGKPMLIMRGVTDRPEALQAGVSRLVGNQKEGIIQNLLELMMDKALYTKMATKMHLYGDGRAALRIVKFLEDNQLMEEVSPHDLWSKEFVLDAYSKIF